MDLSDLTPSGRINQWTLVDGHPRCILDSLASTDAGAVAALQANAAVRALVSKAEAYETAQRLVAQYAGEDVEQPEPTITTTGMDGEETTVANPAYVALEDARALVDGADAVTLALVALRHDGNPEYIWFVDEDSTREAIAEWEAKQATVEAELARLSAEPLATDPRLVPDKIKVWRAQTILHQDNLLDTANALVANSGNPGLISFWASGSSDIYRNSPSLAMIACEDGLNLSDAQLDNLFRRGDALPAL